MSCSSIHLQFIGQLKRGQNVLQRCDTAYISGHLKREDLDFVYRSVFLQAHIGLERAIEQAFIGLVCNAFTHPRSPQPVQVFANAQIAETIIGRGDYVTWLPVDKLEKLAKLYFHEVQNPFLSIQGNLKSNLNVCVKIRNYVAHESSFSEKSLIDSIGPWTRLPKGNQDLLGYLKGTHTTRLNKMEMHLGVLSQVAYRVLIDPVPP